MIKTRAFAPILLLLIIAFFFGFALSSISDTWLIDPDSAAYMGLAQSLTSGNSYSFAGVPHTKYPPCFPLILAGASWLGRQNNFQMMQYVVAAFWILSAGITYLLFSRALFCDRQDASDPIVKNRTTGLVFTLLLAASIYMLQYASAFIRTETVFTFFSLTAVYLGCRLQRNKTPGPGLLLLFLLFFQLALFTRMAGLALLGALVLVFVLDKNAWVRKNRSWVRAIVLLLLCILGPALWSARNRAVTTPASTDYQAEFTQAFGLDLTKNRDLEMESIDLSGLVKRVGENIHIFAESCAKMFLNSNKGGARWPLKLLFGLLCAYGFIRSLIFRRSFVDYYCGLYLLLYFLWPFNQQQRFYLPVLPFLLEYAGISLAAINQTLPKLFSKKTTWHLLLGLQVPVLLYLFLGRSQEPDLFGRYSYQYLALLALLSGAFLTIDCFFLASRKEADKGKGIVRALRTFIPLVYLGGYCFLGGVELKNKQKSHAQFLESRRLNPVLPRFEKITVHPEIITLSTWIVENTREDEVIMSDIPKMLHMLTGRHTVPFTFYSKTKKLAETVAGLRPDYVFYSGEIGWVYHSFKEICQGYEKIFSRWTDAGGGEMIEPSLYRLRPAAPR